MSGIDPNSLANTYQTSADYQQAMETLQNAQDSKSKVFIADDGEVRLASLWDRFSQAFWSIFGYVNHTSEAWVNRSVQTLVDFGQEKGWNDPEILTKIQGIARLYGIVNVPTETRVKETAQTRFEGEKSNFDLGLEELVRRLQFVNAEGKLSIELQVDREEGKVYIKTTDKESGAEEIVVVERAQLEEMAIPQMTQKVVQQTESSQFSLKKLGALLLLIFAGKARLDGQNEQKAAEQQGLTLYKSGNITEILEYRTLPPLPQGQNLNWLDKAVQANDEEVARDLLNRGNQTIVEVLSLSADLKTEFARKLLDRGAQSNIDVLSQAARLNDVGMVQELRGTVDLKSRDSKGLTLLHAAVDNPDPDMLDYLLEQQPNSKENIDAQGSIPLRHGGVLEDATPLTYAIFKGKADNVKKLLDRGANPNLKCKWMYLKGGAVQSYNALELARDRLQRTEAYLEEIRPAVLEVPEEIDRLRRAQQDIVLMLERLEQNRQ